MSGMDDQINVLPREDLDPAGEVFLQCPDVEFQVSSKILALASPVFESMLQNTEFKEARMLRQNGRVEVLLPEDDSDVMRVLLDEIHFIRAHYHETLGVDLQLKLAILCDKDDCVRALRGHSQA